jgi:hypothetical protein
MYVLPEKRHRLCPRVVKAKPCKISKEKMPISLTDWHYAQGEFFKYGYSK